MKIIQQIDESFYRVAIPVPLPLKYVYCYAFKEKDGWSIVDSGLNYEESKQAWKQVFEELGISKERVNTIVITHFHPDHFGLSGWLQQKTGASVFMSHKEADMVKKFWSKNSIQADKVGVMCRENGVPTNLADDIVSHMKRLGKAVLPLPEISLLEKETIHLGGTDWDVIAAPGHSDGLFCLYDKEKQRLIAADHILDRITPNISIWPDCESNPLHKYFQSLEKIKKFPIKLTLPAHGRLIDNLSMRVDEIINHHELRLKKMKDLAKNGATAYDVAFYIFQHKKLTPHQWRFAIAETLAHLEYLLSIKQLKKTKQNDQFVYYQ